jgi:hypothetical protein
MPLQLQVSDKIVIYLLGAYPQNPSNHKKSCGSGFQPRSFKFAAGLRRAQSSRSRSHNKYSLFFTDNNDLFYLEQGNPK